MQIEKLFFFGLQDINGFHLRKCLFVYELIYSGIIFLILNSIIFRIKQKSINKLLKFFWFTLTVKNIISKTGFTFHFHLHNLK